MSCLTRLGQVAGAVVLVLLVVVWAFAFSYYAKKEEPEHPSFCPTPTPLWVAPGCELSLQVSCPTAEPCKLCAEEE